LRWLRNFRWTHAFRSLFKILAHFLWENSNGISLLKFEDILHFLFVSV
jgi:hypothetical protein